MYTSKDGKMMDLKEAINLHAFLLLYTPIWLQDFRISFRSLIIALHDYYGTYPRPAFEEKDWLPDYNDLNDDQIEDIAGQEQTQHGAAEHQKQRSVMPQMTVSLHVAQRIHRG